MVEEEVQKKGAASPPLNRFHNEKGGGGRLEWMHLPGVGEARCQAVPTGLCGCFEPNMAFIG